MPNLKVTIVQADLVWENRKANIDRFERRLLALKEQTHLVVLPEMFTTGFTMNAGPLAETMEGPTLKWMQAMARQLNADLAGSIIVREAGQFFNRLLWASPDGGVRHYDKAHLFRMSGEHEVYRAGRRRLEVMCRNWRAAAFVCYDLRFPMWCRSLKPPYDLAVCVASWPSSRAAHWRTLLQARAIENQCYVVGVNRVGTDGNDQAYSGDSMVIDPEGRVLYQQGDREDVFTAVLPRLRLEQYRREFPAWMDADEQMPSA